MRATRAVRNVTAAEKSVLHVIADHADPTGRCFMALALIAAEACVSESTARRGLRRLEAAGLVASELIKGMGYRFKVAIADEQSHFVTPVNLTGTPVTVTALPPGGRAVNLTDYTDTTTAAPVNLTETPVTVTALPPGGRAVPKGEPSDGWVDVQRLIEADPQFVAFIGAYPKGVGRVDAFRVWWKMSADERAAAAAAVPDFAEYSSDTNERFIPSPAKWLTDRRWLDDYSPRPAVGGVTYGAERMTAEEYHAQIQREKAEYDAIMKGQKA